MTNLERCLAYLAKLPPAVSGSGGHNATLRAACECVRFGLSDSEGMQALGEFNLRCAPAWSERELAHKLASARKLAAGETRQGTRGATPKRKESARTFDHGALERALAARRPAVPPLPAPVATPAAHFDCSLEIGRNQNATQDPPTAGATLLTVSKTKNREHSKGAAFEKGELNQEIKPLHIGEALRLAWHLAETRPDWLPGVAIVRQPVDVEEAYWAEVWRCLGRPDPGLTSGAPAVV